ncbi:hypothetical protein LK994_08715 [Ferruginibacter lapsinanis]|uniref:hypothetical protein n=1 Tax=Ferruginibacter lapsinanis TaxID=563172 RepID=UPI001E61AC1F|nr:hypothetical protein [Ferruginibacter lapsinanis]UEG48717.1 hypothetical protein LK994_08715 [Ferruginibacter lapsinanis]
MFGYILSFVTGALMGFLGNKLFKKKGFGVGENIVAGGVGGLIGDYYLVEYFHSFESRWFLYGLPALIGSVALLAIIFFVYTYDNSEEY